MIRSWANAATRRFAESGNARPFPGLDADRAIRRIVELNAVSSLDQISPLKSVGLHKLKGDRRDQWAMTINGGWRLCFTFTDGDTYDVEIVDYHRG